ncbi:MAG: hypothetical protein L6Q98_16150 [Anaerolineae bacterium]|nr:hypothetical protein [Anaerolineae bacterium]NUQ04724.1 hypothetical protein [Anaerolineae bacterium]
MERSADAAAQPRGRAARFVIAALAALLAAFGAGAQDDSEPDFNRFGVVEAFWLPEDACALGVGWERIIFDWAQHQPTSSDDWNTLNVDDRWLAAARDCGREVVAVVKHTPAWATEGPPNAGVPRGLYLPVDDPGNLWANFMRRAAAYYAERGVSRFIIWNEPDIPAGTYGFIFAGSLDDYFQLLRVASIAARQGNPQAKIHIAGTTYWHDVNHDRRLYVDRLLERIAADPEAAAHGDYFDALTVHVYFRTDTVYDITRANQEALERYGFGDKALWIVETNASPNLDPAWRVERPTWQITLEQQSAFLVQAAALGLAAGAERIAAYKLFDSFLPPGAESFGLIRADESRRPAYETWRMVAGGFADVTDAALAQTTAVDVVRLRHADGRESLVLWARTAEPAEVMVQSAANGDLIDAAGAAVPVRPFNGRHTLALSGAVCNAVDGCAVGGQPAILTLGESAEGVFAARGGVLEPLSFD